jgi:hypothetical protein
MADGGGVRSYASSHARTVSSVCSSERRLAAIRASATSAAAASPRRTAKPSTRAHAAALSGSSCVARAATAAPAASSPIARSRFAVSHWTSAVARLFRRAHRFVGARGFAQFGRCVEQRESALARRARTHRVAHGGLIGTQQFVRPRRYDDADVKARLRGADPSRP